MKIKLFFLILFSLLISFSEVRSESITDTSLKTITDKELCNVDKTKYFWIIYDNVCPYCVESKEHIKALDWQGKFKFLSFRDPITYKMFPHLKKEECEKDIHMVTPTGEVLAGYEVFRKIIDNLTATKLLNPLLNNDVAEVKLKEIYEKLVKERSCYYSMSETCPLKKH
jgi:predicted DCC family thiol-disulfide oxidoreductase YuxK